MGQVTNKQTAMRVIKAKKISGVVTPVDDQGNAIAMPKSPFGIMYKGDESKDCGEYMVFENQQEVDENTPIIEDAPVQGTAIQAFMSATPEEKAAIAEELKSYLNL